MLTSIIELPEKCAFHRMPDNQASVVWGDPDTAQVVCSRRATYLLYKLEAEILG